MQIAFDKTARPEMLIYFTVFINNLVKINLKCTHGEWKVTTSHNNNNNSVKELWGSTEGVVWFLVKKQAYSCGHLLTTAVCGRL